MFVDPGEPGVPGSMAVREGVTHPYNSALLVFPLQPDQCNQAVPYVDYRILDVAMPSTLLSLNRGQVPAGRAVALYLPYDFMHGCHTKSHRRTVNRLRVVIYVVSGSNSGRWTRNISR